MSEQTKRLMTEILLCLQLIGGYFNAANGVYKFGEHIRENPHLARELIQMVIKR